MHHLAAFDLSGRVAVVTGGASGIGRATASVLAAAGATVVVGDVNDAGLRATVRDIEAIGGTVVFERCDIARKQDCDRLVDLAASTFGRLDVMCAVAGVAPARSVVDTTEDELDRVLGINLKGTVFSCQAALRVMTPQGSGSIINVASTIIDAAARGYGVYGMTKAAIAQLTKTLALEAGRDGIRVNTVAPGMTVTPATAPHAFDIDGAMLQPQFDEFVEMMRRLSPLRLVGDALDQAYLIWYLASDASRFCTGQVWRANGGQAMA